MWGEASRGDGQAGAAASRRADKHSVWPGYLALAHSSSVTVTTGQLLNLSGHRRSHL